MTTDNATKITWKRKPVDGTMLTHPGVYRLRSNITDWDETRMWKMYVSLTDVEAVFRSLKSELRLGRFCGNGPELWLNMQQACDLWRAQKKLGDALEKIPAHKSAA